MRTHARTAELLVDAVFGSSVGHRGQPCVDSPHPILGHVHVWDLRLCVIQLERQQTPIGGIFEEIVPERRSAVRAERERAVVFHLEPNQKQVKIQGNQRSRESSVPWSHTDTDLRCAAG